MVDYKIFELKNGVRGVIVPLSGLNSVTVEVFVKIGSKYERRNERGISHFLEHMAFKGTNKRKTATELHKEIDARGAVHNAGTSHELTSYYIKTVTENVGWAVELLADILNSPTLPVGEVEKEAGVVAEEIKMYEDNPTMGLPFEFMDQILVDNGVGCWNITGEVEGILKIERNDLVGYRNKYLNSEEMVVVVAGNVKRSQISDVRCQIEEGFGKFKRKKSVLPGVNLEFSNIKDKRKKRKVESAHFCLGWPTISWKDERRYTARLVEVMLAGNMSSRLNTLIREKHALAYYLFNIGESFAEGGFWGMQAGVKMDSLDRAIELARGEVLNFGKKVREDELARAKTFITGKLKLNMDKTDFWSGFVGQKLLLENKPGNVADELIRYNSVDIDGVRRFANEFFIGQEGRVLALSR